MGKATFSLVSAICCRANESWQLVQTTFQEMEERIKSPGGRTALRKVMQTAGAYRAIVDHAVAERGTGDAVEANIDAIVQRSICGHAAPEMSELYSTVGQKEIQRAVGKVISMAGYQRLTLPGEPGYVVGVHGENRLAHGQTGEAQHEAETGPTR